MNVTTCLSISVEAPTPHLGLAARRGQQAVLFPKLTQKYAIHNCLIPANKNFQLSVTICGNHYMQILQKMEDSSLKLKEN